MMFSAELATAIIIYGIGEGCSFCLRYNMHKMLGIKLKAYDTPASDSDIPL